MEDICFENLYFDTYLEECGYFSTTKDIINKPMFYRAYLNFRLLFWDKVLITDSSINNSEILRSLVMPGNGHVGDYLPQDYIDLIKAGVMCIGCRSENGIESEKPLTDLLLKQQARMNKKITSLPEFSYVKEIDNILNQNSSSKITYGIEDLEYSFHENVNNALQSVYFVDREASDLLLRLFEFIDKNPHYGLNDIRSFIRPKINNPNIRNLDQLLQHTYNMTIPKDIRLNIEMDCDIHEAASFTYCAPLLGSYAIDYYKLAYAKADAIIEIINSSNARKKFLSEVSRNDVADVNTLVSYFDKYILDINYYLNEGFDKRIDWLVNSDEKKQTPLIIYLLGSPEASFISFLMGCFPPSSVIGQVLSLLGAFSSKYNQIIQDETSDRRRKEEERVLWNMRKRNIVVGPS